MKKNFIKISSLQTNNNQKKNNRIVISLLLNYQDRITNKEVMIKKKNQNNRPFQN